VFLFFGICISLVLILGATSEGFTNLLMIPVTENQSLRKSDVIIVLGAGSRTTAPHLPPQADARVTTGVELMRDGWAPRMIVSGGYNQHTGLTEAPLMAEIAYSKGATEKQVIQEPTSKNTWENATNSLEIVRKNAWKTVLVVSSPYHTWRACMIFKKQQADVHCIAAPLRTERSHSIYERLMDTRSVVREYGAIVYFFLRHYI
jgi:uncharacterized SAM-binding protein YcdF (DUF218 family)